MPKSTKKAHQIAYFAQPQFNEIAAQMAEYTDDPDVVLRVFKDGTDLTLLVSSGPDDPDTEPDDDDDDAGVNASHPVSRQSGLLIAEIAHQMALLPILWLSVQAWRGNRQDVAFWWTAMAFFVSWIADTFTDTLPADQQWIPVMAFPLGQCALIAAVWLPSRRLAAQFVALLTLAGLLVALTGNLRGPDLILSSVANFGVAWIAWNYREIPARMRACLAVYFGLGGILWLVHALDVMYFPEVSVRSWYGYQLSRLVGLILFCFAVSKTAPTLHVSRAT